MLISLSFLEVLDQGTPCIPKKFYLFIRVIILIIQKYARKNYTEIFNTSVKPRIQNSKAL